MPGSTPGMTKSPGAGLVNKFFPSRSCLAALFLPALAANHASAARIRHPVAVFAGLDKITGRTMTFEASAGETVQFGTLQITERACFTHPATETPQTASFVEVDEVSGGGKQYKRIFSGWMFAASPGLHGIEHPIYDVWLTNCAGEGTLEGKAEAAAEAPPPADSAAAQEAAPAGEAKKSRRHRRAGPAESAPPAASAPAPSPPAVQDEPGSLAQEPAAPEAPSLGQPIEVAPPPGFIPVPQAGRNVPSRRFYPADPGAVSEPPPDEPY
jgi:hypothetical protein